MSRARFSRRQVLAVFVVVAGVVLAMPAMGQASVGTARIAVGVSNHSPAVGATFTVTAVAKTASGQTDRSFNGPATWSDRSGQLSPSAPSDFVNGVSTTTGVAVGVPFHSDTITVSSNSLSGKSGRFNVYGQLNHFSFGLSRRTMPVGTSFTVTISARDAGGNLLTGYSGSPSWSDSSGSLSPSSPAAFSGGVSTNPTTQVANPAHLDRITVDDTSAGVQSSSNTFNEVGPFNHFAFSKLPQPLGTNQPFTLVVRAVDSAGNIVTGYSGSPTWSDTSTSLSPGGPAPFVDGVSVNSCTRVGNVQAGDLIMVDDASAGVDSTSPAFDVTAAQVFGTPGSSTFRLPCAADITVTAIGAAGGEAGGANCVLTGGEAAVMVGTLSVSGGQQLSIGVGGVGASACGTTAGSGGSGGGGNGGTGTADGGSGAGGGGASYVSLGTPSTSSMLMLGGGGGGASASFGGGVADGTGLPGSVSGCPNSEAGLACGGAAGDAGGTAGAGDGNSGDTDGTNGSFLTGGNGGSGGAGGGGGGSGVTGGGGGGGALDHVGGSENFAGSGGGGKSFIASGAVNTIAALTSEPAEVSITYAPPT